MRCVFDFFDLRSKTWLDASSNNLINVFESSNAYISLNRIFIDLMCIFRVHIYFFFDVQIFWSVVFKNEFNDSLSFFWIRVNTSKQTFQILITVFTTCIHHNQVFELSPLLTALKGDLMDTFCGCCDFVDLVIHQMTLLHDSYCRGKVVRFQPTTSRLAKAGFEIWKKKKKKKMFLKK